MKSLVVYSTRSGNTRTVAERIARTLAEHGEASTVAVEVAPAVLPDVDLVVIGGQTEAHGMTPPMVEFLDRIDRHSLEGKKAAAFDTRLSWPKLISGSAADGIARYVVDMGAELIAPPESFIVDRKPQLKSGELDRVEPWALALVAMVEDSVPVGAV